MVSVDYRSIAVQDLHFDPDNPRIPTDIDGSDDTQVTEWMLKDAGLVELMGSIAAKGFFPAEPLLITDREDGSGFTVLEGNRRLAAVRLLLDPDSAPQRGKAVSTVSSEVSDRSSLQHLPCAVFGSRDEVLDYLGFRHVTGVKQWEPEAKARYIEALYQRHLPEAGDDVYRLIARLIGSRSDYVARLLASLHLHEQICKDDELQELLADDEVPYSLVTLAVTYRAITSYLNIDSLEEIKQAAVDPERLRDLATWMYHVQPALGRTQLGESHSMKLLAQAITQDEGIDALKRGETVEEAAAATVNADELMIRALRQSRDRLLAAQRLLHRVTVTPVTLDVLNELEDLLDQMQSAVRRKVKRAERDSV
jgi:hypothetical protein